MASSYEIAGSNIVHQLIEDEVVIINLDVGHYYSLTTTGAEIWSLIMQGLSRDNIVETMFLSYDAQKQVIAEAVDHLIRQLAEEKIIKCVASDDSSESEDIIQEKTAKSTKNYSFEFPVLQKYTDMQDMLLLDPIHDVDETGWPNPQK